MFFFSDIFLTSKEIEKSLANRETGKCLIWCHDNKHKLRKLKSNMEFNLRIQEFIEMIRSDRRIEAIKHARKHFPNFEDEHLATIQKVMALLAFPTSTGVYKNKRIYISLTSYIAELISLLSKTMKLVKLFTVRKFLFLYTCNFDSHSLPTSQVKSVAS